MDGSQIRLTYMPEEIEQEGAESAFEEVYEQMEIPFKEDSSEKPDNSGEMDPGTS